MADPVRVLISGATESERERIEASLKAADIARLQVHTAPDDVATAIDKVRALVHQSVSDSVFYLSVEGERFRFVEVNPAFLKATGLTADQVQGKFVDEVIPEPSLSIVVGNYHKAIAEGRTVSWEEITPYPAGTKYGEVSITPVVDEYGRCFRLVGIVRDVSEARNLAESVRRYADIVRAVKTGLTVWNVPDASDASPVTLLASNPAAERFAGVDLTRALGAPFHEVVGFSNAGEILAAIRAVAVDRTARSFPSLHPPGEARTFAAQVFPLGGTSVALAVEDVSADARARAVAQTEQLVLERVASGAQLRESLEGLVLLVEQELPETIASVLLVSPDGKRLERGAAPHLPDAYNSAIDGGLIGPKAGSCGSAAALGKPVIVTDIVTDPRWDDYRELAARFDLRACWSVPVLDSTGRVLGTFAVYYRQPRAPVRDELDLIFRVSHVAGIAIQRNELDEQMRNLTARLDAAREEERTDIAREIHDQLGQALTVLKMDMAWIGRRARGTDGIAPQILLEKLEELMRGCDGVINEIRRISAELRPALLDSVGLAAAIDWEAQETERRFGISCKVTSDQDIDHGLERNIATAIFRVFQEALVNVLRHADAKNVEARLGASDGAVVLEVRDDGRGITPREIQDPHSLGLLGMRERARRFGGQLTVAAREERGTVVTLTLPRHAPPPASEGRPAH